MTLEEFSTLNEGVLNTVKLAEEGMNLPDLSVGYYNQSFKEINTNRFQSFMVGISVPIFQGSINANVKSAETAIKIQENEIQNKKNNLNQEIAQLENEVSTYNQIIESYKKTQLPEAISLQKAIEQQLLSGEINFLDWVILNDQIIDLQNQFAEHLFTRNIKANSLNFLAN